jgi:2,4-dienoyl-CoA reductase-like NADH-dependent reductase (Old Yellow Enzyme family)
MSALFTPISIRTMTLPNRIVVPAMVTRLAGEDGVVNDEIRARYVRYAKGGAGLIVVEAMAVHQSKSGPLLRICADAFRPGLADLAALCHDAGPGMVVPQIIHFLKISRSGWRQTIDMLSPEDIEAIVEAHGQAAARARLCGFDGVELHMAHAYTLSSFLSRLNPRRDVYGGTLENRLRLPVRVVERVRQCVGWDFPVGVRFLGEECIRHGYTVVDATPIAVRLARAGVDYISLSAGGKFEDARSIPGQPLYPYTGYSGDRCMPGSNYPDGANLYMPEAVRAGLREHGLATPVVAAGKIATRELAERVIERDIGDLVGMARALLADPDLPKKWQAGRDGKVVRCVYGNVCKALDESFRRVRCTLWPKRLAAAPESDDQVPPAWPEQGARLAAEYGGGRVLLRWSAATDNEEVYGYQIFRSDGDSLLRHYTSARAATTRFEDARVIGGATYKYALRAYDLAGNRSPMSEAVQVTIPDARVSPDRDVHRASDPGELEACTRATGGDGREGSPRRVTLPG